MELAAKVKSMSGEDVLSCFQCGLCSGSCPVRFAMDSSPTRIIRLVQLGKIEAIFNSQTFRICSTCYSCKSRCPQNINITKIMDALRQIRLRRDQDEIKVKEILREDLAILPPIALVSNFRKKTS